MLYNSDMANRFKNKMMRDAYENSIANARNGCYRNTDGSPNYGSSHATHFWHGYNGVKAGYANPDDAEYRTTIGYACYRAGVDYAKELLRSK